MVESYNMVYNVVDIYFYPVISFLQAGQIIIFGGVCKDTEKRSHRIYSLWVKVPSLQELCWQTMLCNNPCLEKLSQDELLSAGVPAAFVDRLEG